MSRRNSIPPYFFHVQQPFSSFWSEYGTADRRVLFLYGVGFDPRSVPALRAVCNSFGGADFLTTVCARFTNLFDRRLSENQRYTRECLSDLRRVRSGLGADNSRHFEIEVNLLDSNQKLIGDELIREEFAAACGDLFRQATDVIVDVSAFPRSLIYTLLGHLFHQRQAGQNLFAVLTDIDGPVPIEEDDFADPVLLLTNERTLTAERLWIPVLGGKTERLRKIYEYLQPKIVLPIVPFPAANPRSGDEICLAARPLFDEWQVPFENVMYAAGHAPFDVFRKISDAAVHYRDLVGEFSIVVSALSGRSLSLGVLMAALWENLAICHTQPATYAITPEARQAAKAACVAVDPILYWLGGRLYEDSAADRVQE